MTTLRISDDLKLPAGVVTATRDDLVWAAGLFEGEGTIAIAIRRQDETYRMLCSVGNTDRSVIEFFQDRWVGWLQPGYGKGPRRRPSWSWTVVGPRAENFLRMIESHIRTARVRSKLDLALAFRRRQSNDPAIYWAPDYRPALREIYERMRVLNRRGVPV